MGSGATQGKLWGAKASDWAEYQEPTQAGFYKAVFEVVGIGPGKKLLDAGCGAGLALQIAAKLGAEVAGNDASQGLLAIAKQRLPKAELRLEDLEDTSFDPGSFDIVTSFMAVQFAADPVNALRMLSKVVKAGGQIALITWGLAEKCEMRDIIGAMASLLPPPPSGAGGPFTLGEPGKLEELAQSAGLKPGTSGEVDCPFEYPNIEVAIRANLSAGLGVGVVQVVGEGKVREVLTRPLSKYQKSDGSVKMENSFRYLISKV